MRLYRQGESNEIKLNQISSRRVNSRKKEGTRILFYSERLKEESNETRMIMNY